MVLDVGEEIGPAGIAGRSGGLAAYVGILGQAQQVGQTSPCRVTGRAAWPSWVQEVSSLSLGLVHGN